MPEVARQTSRGLLEILLESQPKPSPKPRIETPLIEAIAEKQDGIKHELELHREMVRRIKTREIESDHIEALKINRAWDARPVCWCGRVRGKCVLIEIGARAARNYDW